MFRRAAINAALGSAHSFYSNLGKWCSRREKAQAKGKKFTERPPVPPRSWNKSATLYAGQWKERAGSSIMIKVWTGSVWSWMKGRIFNYVKYKAYNEGILTSRVNPRNTSRECARCHSLIARYDTGKPAEGYTYGVPLVACAECGMRGNASLVIGQRLVERYQKPLKEKPHTRLVSERVEQSTGVVISQVAKSRKEPSIPQARHGDHNEHGTAQERTLRMDEPLLEPVKIAA